MYIHTYLYRYIHMSMLMYMAPKYIPQSLVNSSSYLALAVIITPG